MKLNKSPEHLRQILDQALALDNDSRFWIIWNPSSGYPPTSRFVSHAQARVAAEKMAVRFSGQQFYVLEASEYFQTEKVVRKQLRQW